jgi:hypothetical protein
LSVLAREIRGFPPRQGRLQKELQLRSAVLSLDSGQCAAVAAMLNDAPAPNALTDVAFDLFSRWESLDRDKALAAATSDTGRPLQATAQAAVLHAWSHRDAPGMLAAFVPELNGSSANPLALAACRQALRAWAETSPREALNAAAAVGGMHGPTLIDSALIGWTEGEAPDEALAWLANEATPEQQSLHYRPLIGYLQDRCPDKAWNSLAAWPDRAVAGDEACSTLNLWAAHDPAAAVAAWLAGPAEWQNRHFAFNLAQVLEYSNPELKRKLARELPDPKMRESMN